jgi:hypothetical protein
VDGHSGAVVVDGWMRCRATFTLRLRFLFKNHETIVINQVSTLCVDHVVWATDKVCFPMLL